MKKVKKESTHGHTNEIDFLSSKTKVHILRKVANKHVYIDERHQLFGICLTN